MKFSLKPVVFSNISLDRTIFKKAVCRINNCKNKSFRKLNMCALHCSEKSIDNNDVNEYITSFYKLLSEYLDREITVEIHRNRDGSQSELEARDELEEVEQVVEEYHLFVGGMEPYGISTRLRERLEKIDIILTSYHFPNDNDMEHLDSEYHQLLRYLRRVGFLDCDFNTPSFNLNSNFYYKNCEFISDFVITPFPEFENSEEYCYSNCIFKGNVHISSSNDRKEISCNLFKECKFRKNIIINNLNFKKSLFNFPKLPDNFKDKNFTDHFNEIKKFYKIENLTITECIFEYDFKINGFDSDYITKLELHNINFEMDDLVLKSLKISDTKFESKLEIKNRTIQDFEFKNSNVEKVFDAFESRFEKLYFYKSIFTDFAGFEKVDFGLEGQDIEAYQAKFIYTTFMSFSNFRRTKFLSGLDFENSNLKEQPNFLKTYINSENTNRETFRIIKHSFDAKGNKLEANKFFIYEMKAYSKELLATKGNYAEKFVFFTNYLASSFGRSYIRPFVLLVILLGFYVGFYEFYQAWYQNSIYSLPEPFRIISKVLNNSAKSFLPFSRFIEVRKGFEFISLLFYILFAILTWQIIIAVKRHTER